MQSVAGARPKPRNDYTHASIRERTVITDNAAACLRQTVSPAVPNFNLSPGMPLNSDVVRALSALAPHSLDSLKNAVLMSRVDSKYLLPITLAADLLASMSLEYSVLEIDGLRSFNYVTTYYDTPASTHYIAHHNGRLNRFKIRKRTYTESGSSYIEVKLKDYRGRTTKTRMSCNTQEFELGKDSRAFLSSCGVPNPLMLQPVQTGTYRRVALANEERGERLTIDFNLRFLNERDGNHHALGPWAIAELKQDRLNRKSAYFSWARRHAVRALPFSKYCMGVYFTGAPELKRNNFHAIARRLNNLPVYKQECK